MRLLFISSFYLFGETRYGGSKRLYYFAREWARHAQLTLINLDICAEWPGRENPHQEFKDLLILPERKGTGWHQRFFSAHEDMRSILRSQRHTIRKFLESRHFDAVLLAYPWALSFLDGHLDGIDAPITYLEDDLSFERYRAESDTAHSLFSQGMKRMRRRQTLAFYRSHMGRVSKFVGISQQEIDVMARHFPKPKPYLASYGIPLEEFAVLPSSGEEFVLGFIGNYGHPPNVDVLRWLAEGLADTIRLYCPGVRFALAGKGIPAWAHEHFRDQKDVRIYENVQNLKDFYSGISVFLNPIRTGRGMRTKLVEAAAFGRPIVSTTLGAEGLDDLQITCADDAQGLAEACLALSRDARLGASTARNRMIIENHYSLGKIGAELLDFLISAQ